MINMPLKFWRLALLALTWLVWWWALSAPASHCLDLATIVGGVLSIFPIVWLGRRLLDNEPTPSHAALVTTFVHYGVGMLLGATIFRAVATHADWTDWLLPVPTEIGLILVIVTGIATLLSVVNLALKGLGAPFAIALSQKLAADWLYAWTRNPMVLAGVGFVLSLGIWYQSTLFVLWALFGFAPATLFFVKVYEERELEIRFGKSYLAYKAKTPMLFPRRPRG